jgi:hypothetical protein
VKKAEGQYSVHETQGSDGKWHEPDVITRLRQRVGNDFTYHPPHGDQVERFTDLRSMARSMAQIIVSCTPVSREQSLALTNLEQALMWANAAIARNEKPAEDESEGALS